LKINNFFGIFFLPFLFFKCNWFFMKNELMEKLKKLIKENLDTIFAYSKFITGNREDAMDLMQDTIVIVLKKSHLYKEQDSFKSWIFRILKNNYLNTIKKKSIQKELFVSEIEKDNDSEPYNFKDKKNFTQDPFLKERILKVFSEMPEEYQMVTYLINIEGHSYEEVSKMLKIPVGTVMSRLHRGRDFLKSKLIKEAKEAKILKMERKNA